MLRAAVGERHPETAIELNNLALLLEAQADHAGAEPLLRQALEISRRNLELAAAAQSERQQLAMAQMLRRRLDAFAALPRPTNAAPPPVIDPERERQLRALGYVQ